ncbi:MAG: DUF938 domain-containing protein [Steroidobacteraceae bacterium]
MDVADKTYSAACERNREPILEVLRGHFADRREVLEIGSGTGQHAAWFARHLPHLTWHSSDVEAHLPGIRAWLADPPLPNAPPPFALDVAGDWPARRWDAAFTSNTLHIMSWTEVQRMFQQLDAALADDAVLAIYGPFNRDGRPTCDSNAAFDASLRARAAHMGLRDAAAVDALASAIGLRLVAEVEMPANNLTRVWRRP